MFKHLIQTRSSQAFTLVELLVVIGIIAILVGVLLPALNRAREESNSLKCLSNLKTIGQAVAIYEATYDGWLPAGETGNNTTDTHWDATLQQLLGRSGDISNAVNNSTSPQTSAGLLAQAFLCPSHQVDPDPNGGYECDYSAHPRLMPRVGQPVMGDKYDTGAAPMNNRYPPMHQIKGLEIPHSSEVILVADGVQLQPQPGGLFNTNSTNWSAQDVLEEVDANVYGTGPKGTGVGPGCRFCSDGWSDAYLGSQIYVNFKLLIAWHTDQNFSAELGTIAWRHLGNTATNCLFLDGHADSFTVGNNPRAARVLVGSDTTGSPSYQTNLLRKYLYTPYR